MKTIGLYLGFILATVDITIAQSAAPNRVYREIRLNGGSLIVHDMLTINESFAFRARNVFPLFKAARDGKTNLTHEVHAFLAGESLTIEDHSVKLRDQFVDVVIVSKVVFGTDGRPAQLRWVPTLGWQGFEFPNLSLVPTNAAQVLAYQADGNFVLWFPDLGLPDRILSDLKSAREGLEFITQEDTEFSCLLNVEGAKQRLFHWTLNRKGSPSLSSPFIKQLHAANKMSLNDLLTLSTNFKVAKPGFYSLR